MIQVLKFTNHWLGQVFAAADNSKARGVIVLGKELTPIKMNSYIVKKKDNLSGMQVWLQTSKQLVKYQLPIWNCHGVVTKQWKIAASSACRGEFCGCSVSENNMKSR